MTTHRTQLKNLKLKDALKLAEQRGCKVWWPGNSGEVMVSHPDVRGGAYLRMNGRQKDAPYVLVQLLRKLEPAETAEPAEPAKTTEPPPEPS